jgi:hypothetical protein
MQKPRCVYLNPYLLTSWLLPFGFLGSLLSLLQVYPFCSKTQTPLLLSTMATGRQLGTVF